VDTEETGAIYTRTGRAFLDGREQTEAALARVRAAADAAGLWEALDTGWLVLDCELLPWSAKAMQLIRRQYAAVGAAARAGLSSSIETNALPGAASTSPHSSTTSAGATSTSCATPRPTGGTRGRSRASTTSGSPRSMSWRRRAASSSTAATTGTSSSAIDSSTPEPAGCSAPSGSWSTSPTRGAKPPESPGGKRSRPAAARAWSSSRRPSSHAVARGLVQPGIKCRGREYLRIIYGPEYLDETQIARLRSRGLGRKRSLAVREFGLGVEALERFVRQEPLHRVHECVFGVLAMETDPVDPRL